MSKKKFNEAEFKEFCKEAIPHIEALQKLLEDRDMENLGSLNFSADGYPEPTASATPKASTGTNNWWGASNT